MAKNMRAYICEMWERNDDYQMLCLEKYQEIATHTHTHKAYKNRQNSFQKKRNDDNYIMWNINTPSIFDKFQQRDQKICLLDSCNMARIQIVMDIGNNVQIS